MMKDKECINIPIDDNKGISENTHYRDSFITTCIKELYYLGTCICFTKEHLELIGERLGHDNIEYEYVDDYYYSVTYSKNRNKK